MPDVPSGERTEHRMLDQAFNELSDKINAALQYAEPVSARRLNSGKYDDPVAVIFTKRELHIVTVESWGADWETGGAWTIKPTNNDD